MNQYNLTIIFLVIFCACTVGTDTDGDLGFEIVEDFDIPEIQIVSPLMGDSLKGNAKIDFEVQDFSGIRDVQLWVNQTPEKVKKNKTSSDTYTIEWDTRELIGNFDIKLIATDNFGNEGESDSVSVVINNLRITDYFNRTNTSLSSSNIERIEFDSEGTAYVSTTSEIYKNVDGDWSPITFSGINVNPGSLYDFHIDRFDSIWVSSRIIIDTSNRHIYFSSKNDETKMGPKDGFFYDQILDIFRDIDDVVWLATGDGMYSNDNGVIKKSEDFGSDTVFEIGGNEKGYPIITALGSTYSYDGNAWIKIANSEYCSSFTIDAENAIWCLNSRHGSSVASKLYKIENNTAELIIDERIPGNVIQFDEKNNLWLGGNNFVYLLDEGEFIPYSTKFDMGTFFTNNWMNQIKIGPNGKIWIATGHGLIIAEY